MRIVQLMASPFLGGPERQMIGLALALPRAYHTTFLSFSERGLCRSFLQEVVLSGMRGIELKHNFPDIRRALQEVAIWLRRLRADIICCSGYKPDLIGLIAGKQVGIPVISVSHGWTGASLKVRVNETLDRLALRWMDAVVCVSEGQAVKVRKTGAPQDRIHVIRNAVSLERFVRADPKYRKEMEAFFRVAPRRIVGAAGRLSPEKGFEKLIEAAAVVVNNDPSVGFVVFGEGPCRQALSKLIAAKGLADHVVLPGFRGNLEAYLPHFDLLALSSYTEGLPVIVLEAMAAGLATVATAVGGVAEVIEDGIHGRLVRAGDSQALAHHIVELLSDEHQRHEMGKQSRKRVEVEFSFVGQSAHYQRLFEQVLQRPNGTDIISPKQQPMVPMQV